LDAAHHLEEDEWGSARIVEDGIGRNLFESVGREPGVGVAG
jgi:hypothetical protein